MVNIGQILSQSLKERKGQKAYTADEVVLVVDTSFLIGLSNLHLWAYDALQKVDHIAKSSNRSWEWYIPLKVNSQYYRLLEEKVKEVTTKLPFANRSIDDLISTTEFIISTERYSTEQVQEIWKKSIEDRKVKVIDPESPGEVDLDLIGSAIGIAQSGADVYVASSDFKDTINPLKDDAELLHKQGLRITPLAPANIDFKHWDPRIKPLLRSTVTAEVIRDLQDMNSTSSSYPVVIFEKNVKSGDAFFDAGIGVAEKMYLRPLELSGAYDCIDKNYYALPAIQVKSLNNQTDVMGLVRFSKGLNQLRMVVTDKEHPHVSYVVDVMRGKTRGNAKSLLISPNLTFRTDLSFLYWDSDCKFAKVNYKPRFMTR
jgi:hypothetical protein